MSNKKKLILITSCFPYGHGETFLETEIPYLSKAFDDIIIIPITVENHERSLPGNVIVDTRFANQKKSILIKILTVFSKCSFYKYLSISSKFNRILFIWTFYAHALKNFLVKFYKKDIKYCTFYSYWFNFVPVAFHLLKEIFPKTIFISRAHGSDIFENVHQISVFPYRKEVLQSIDKIFSISNKGKDHIISKYHVNKGKLMISRLGTKRNYFKNSPSKDGIFRVASCSNMIPLKRIDLLISALSLLDKNENFKIHWYHIGDGILYEELKTQANRELGNQVNFTFLGRINNDKVYEFYKTNPIDLFCNLSISEGIPVSIMEVQSLGIPSLATNVGGTHEIVNNKNGWLVDCNINKTELANLLILILSDKTTIQKKRINSFQNWENHYNAKSNYTNFGEIIQSINLLMTR